jgi:hypothetical protein
MYRWKQMNFCKQAKTDTLFRVTPLPVAIDILEKYKEHPAIVNSNKSIARSNQKYNE